MGTTSKFNTCLSMNEKVKPIKRIKATYHPYRLYAFESIKKIIFLDDQKFLGDLDRHAHDFLYHLSSSHTFHLLHGEKNHL